MRDFRAGGNINVDDDLIIIDESARLPALCGNCSTEVFLGENEHRRGLVTCERAGRDTKALI
jgi:hypothetical protein